MGSINVNTKVKKIKLKGYIEEIKSKYILQKIFENLRAIRSLKIIKYNKNIQNKINLNIKEYF